MIVNIRGTSGSGKSTLVRRVMDTFGEHRQSVHVEGRKQPIAYHLGRHDGEKFPLAVLGHYETPCGGCDTITAGFDAVYDLIYEHLELAHHVIFEGVLLHSEVRRTVELADHVGRENLLVLALDVAVETCLAGVNARRWRRDPTLPPVNPHHTEQKHRSVPRGLERLREHDVTTLTAGRELAFQIVMEAITL